MWSERERGHTVKVASLERATWIEARQNKSRGGRGRSDARHQGAPRHVRYGISKARQVWHILGTPRSISKQEEARNEERLYAPGATLTLHLAHHGSSKRRGFFMVAGDAGEAGADGKAIPLGKRKIFT